MADLIKTKDPAIASYDYNDIEDGTGTVINYLYRGRDTSNNGLWKIGRETPMSTPIEITYGLGHTTDDFYSGEFGAPRVMQGTMILSFGWDVGDCTGNLIIKIYHYDGSTSTQLGSTWTSTNGAYTNVNLFIDVPTTKFRRGDQLRIEIEGWRNSTGAQPFSAIGVSPQNLDGTYITPSNDATQQTTFIARLPFRIGVQ